MELTVRLSSRQYRMLQNFMQQNRVAEEDLMRLNQVTAGALLRRGLLRRNHRTAEITAEGRAAIQQFATAEIMRKVVSARLSTYYENYHRLTVLRRGKAA